MMHESPESLVDPVHLEAERLRAERLGEDLPQEGPTSEDLARFSNRLGVWSASLFVICLILRCIHSGSNPAQLIDFGHWPSAMIVSAISCTVAGVLSLWALAKSPLGRTDAIDGGLVAGFGIWILLLILAVARP
jgi:hypothetical protein